MSAVLFPAPLLSVERLSIQFGTQRVVDDVSFALWPGKTLCIAGESGSGKSLTSLAIMGLLPEEAQIPGGAIIFDNQDLLSLPERQMQLLGLYAGIPEISVSPAPVPPRAHPGR